MDVVSLAEGWHPPTHTHTHTWIMLHVFLAISDHKRTEKNTFPKNDRWRLAEHIFFKNGRQQKHWDDKQVEFYPTNCPVPVFPIAGREKMGPEMSGGLDKNSWGFGICSAGSDRRPSTRGEAAAPEAHEVAAPTEVSSVPPETSVPAPTETSVPVGTEVAPVGPGRVGGNTLKVRQPPFKQMVELFFWMINLTIEKWWFLNQPIEKWWLDILKFPSKNYKQCPKTQL